MGTEEKEAPVSVGMDAFNVSKLSNEGVKLPLSLPDGTATAEYLVVCGADSTKFRNHRARADRDKVKLSKRTKEQDPAEMARLTAEIDRELVATLIVDWSFPEPCEKANVCKFLADSPQIQAQVDLFAGNRANFFAKPPKG